MTIAHARIGDLVGEGLFFEHVSARMAFKLPALHDRGLVIGSCPRHTYPQSDSGGSVEYYSNERATQWNGYDGNPANLLFPASGKRVLLDVVDNLRVLGPDLGGCGWRNYRVKQRLLGGCLHPPEPVQNRK